MECERQQNQKRNVREFGFLFIWNNIWFWLQLFVNMVKRNAFKKKV